LTHRHATSPRRIAKPAFGLLNGISCVATRQAPPALHPHETVARFEVIKVVFLHRAVTPCTGHAHSPLAIGLKLLPLRQAYRAPGQGDRPRSGTSKRWAWRYATP